MCEKTSCCFTASKPWRRSTRSTRPGATRPFLAWAVEGACGGGLTACRAYARPDLGTSDDVISDADAGVLKPYMKKEPLFDGICNVPRRGDGPDGSRSALGADEDRCSASPPPLRAPGMPESHRMFEKLFSRQ